MCLNLYSQCLLIQYTQYGVPFKLSSILVLFFFVCFFLHMLVHSLSEILKIWKLVKCSSSYYLTISSVLNCLLVFYVNGLPMKLKINQFLNEETFVLVSFWLKFWQCRPIGNLAKFEYIKTSFWVKELAAFFFIVSNNCTAN